MKGLLLKDFYMIRKYCGTHLIMALIFTVISFFNDNIMFMFYPCLMSGLIPMTIQSFDEKENWCEYSQAMPYTTAQLVAVKYITGIILSAVFTLIIIIGRLVRMYISPETSVEIGLPVLVSAMSSLFSIAVMMPPIFKLGVEKGRGAYFMSMIVIGGVLYGVLAGMDDGSVSLNGNIFIALICISVVIAYFISWRLSVKFYAEKDF